MVDPLCQLFIQRPVKTSLVKWDEAPACKASLAGSSLAAASISTAFNDTLHCAGLYVVRTRPCQLFIQHPVDILLIRDGRFGACGHRILSPATRDAGNPPTSVWRDQQADLLA